MRIQRDVWHTKTRMASLRVNPSFSKIKLMLNFVPLIFVAKPLSTVIGHQLCPSMYSYLYTYTPEYFLGSIPTLIEFDLLDILTFKYIYQQLYIMEILLFSSFSFLLQTIVSQAFIKLHFFPRNTRFI